MSYILSELKHFGNSFLINKKFIYVFFVELVFFILIAGAYLGWEYSLAYSSDKVSEAKDSITDQGNLAQVNSFISAFKVFLAYLIGMSFALIIAFLILWTISRCLVWGELTGKKISFRMCAKFFFMKIAWQLLWLPLTILLLSPIYLFSAAVRANPGIAPLYAGVVYFDTLFLFMIAYFGLFLYHSFFQHLRIYKALTDSFREGTKRFTKMIFPLTLSIAAAILASVIAYFSASFKVFSIAVLLYAYTGIKIYLIEKSKPLID